MANYVDGLTDLPGIPYPPTEENYFHGETSDKMRSAAGSDLPRLASGDLLPIVIRRPEKYCDYRKRDVPSQLDRESGFSTH